MKTQTLFSGKWVQTKPLVVPEPTRLELRRSQARAFAGLKDKPRVVLQAPTGWGKSLVIASLVLYKLLRNPELRCIIAVPQTLIARGFVRDWTLRIAGRLVDWVVQHNLCHKQASDTVASLIRFLRDGHTSLGDRILVCTHATLGHAYKRLKARRQLALLKNVALWIDEGHHVKNAQVTGQHDAVSNALGALATYCVTHGNHVGLATATYMRGDARHILPDKMLAAFTHVKVPYDLYFEEVQPVESFEFNIIAGDTFKALDAILGTLRPTILYLAKRNSRYAGRCKYLEVKQVLRRLSKRLNAPIRRQGELILVGDLKVLDLVTEKGREARKAYLDDGGHVDIIIALDTCKEGFDWPEAERSIILGERHSVPELIQMIGRLFRRAKGKTHAEVYQILPAAVPNSKRFKDQRNAILTVIFSAMLLEDVFLPISLATRPTKGKRDHTDRLVSTIPDTETWQALSRDFLVAANGRDYDQSWRLAPSILKKYDIAKMDWEHVWKKLWQRHALVARKMKGLRLGVPFEVLKTTDLSEGLLTLASGLCGAMTFQELRKLIGRETRTPEEQVLIAENLAKKHDGVLPNSKWLQQHGYHGLDHNLRQHPELFAHIPQENKRGRTREEWVPIAERLAEENGGTLPYRKWLDTNDYSGLTNALRQYPELFVHIPQENKGGRTCEEWVPIAERLAEENGGTLPYPAQLQKSGFYGLKCALAKHPKLFAHVPQESKRGRVPDEWVPIADRLAEKNGGKLPNHGWLQKNNYRGLSQVLYKLPDLFQHLIQEKKLYAPDEWVGVAEQLASANGTLPSCRWLHENGYGGLPQRLRDFPELFAHIPRESRRLRHAKAIIVLAEQLAAAHGGTLPNAKWLQTNGHSGVDAAMRKFPQLFAHIPQDSKKGRAPEEWVPTAEKLAKERGGVLPSRRWLRKHGFTGLSGAKRRRPELFEHLVQKRLRAA